MRGVKRWLYPMALATTIAVACGARTELPTGRAAEAGTIDAGHDAPEDARPDAPEDARPDVFVSDCADAGVTYIYVVTSQNELYSYDPSNHSFTLRGLLDCPAGAGATPFSMGVDRLGTAFVVFNDGQLYRVSTFDASCEETGYLAGQQGFDRFGMGFATDEGGPEEKLYVAEINFAAPSLGLATIDTETLELSYINPFSDETLGFAAELTGTGVGSLHAYFLDEEGFGGDLVEIDKNTAEILSKVHLDVGVGGHLAFAFWGGDFYIFTSQDGSEATAVTRYRPDDGTVVVVASLPTSVVGAGVSTCAPQH
jgi:hypothetical protein